MNIFILKIIATFFMIVDHIKYAFPSFVNEFTQYFGRVSFPLFSFCVVQGYLHTKDVRKYIIRLIVAGIISEIPYLLFYSLPTLQSTSLNILFSFGLGLIAIVVYESYPKKIKGFVAVLLIGLMAQIGNIDYGIFGVMLTFSFYIFNTSKFKTLLASSIVVAGKYLYRILILGVGFTEYPIKNWICTMIPLFIILLYNGKKGPGLKWFFYIFYPVHFLLLWLFSPYTAII